jgi:hypothetical protein
VSDYWEMIYTEDVDERNHFFEFTLPEYLHFLSKRLK